MSPHKMVRGTFAVLVASLAIGPAQTWAADLHVTDGSGDCTSEAQGCDLAAALTVARPGDRVLVHPGVHSVSGTVSDFVSGVVVRGAPNESRPVIDVSGGELLLTHGTDLESLDIVAASGTAVLTRGGTLDHLRIGVTGPNTIGVDLGAGAVLRNSMVIANGTNATGVMVSSGGMRSELRGATILASGTGAQAALVDPDAPGGTSGLRAVNTILSGSGGAFDIRAHSSGAQSATVVLDHSATSLSAQSAIGPGSAIDTSRDTVTAAPRFVDRAAGDLRQAADSPTIDAGTADVDGDGDVDADDDLAAGATDLDRTPRRLGDPDIGADEREMPPVVLASEPIYDGTGFWLRVTVQPHGLATQVAAEWGVENGESTTTTAQHATGNSPVILEIPLGALPPGAQLSVRAHASNSAGSAVTSAATVAVPVAAPVTAAPASASAGAAPAVRAPAAGLPGALPVLRSVVVQRHWGILAIALTCKQTISCRGSLLLTRLGTPRWTTFAIAPGKTKTVSLTLTGAQQRRGKLAGRRGERGLLEIRSTQMGSSFQAVRLVAREERRRSR